MFLGLWRAKYRVTYLWEIGRDVGRPKITDIFPCFWESFERPVQRNNSFLKFRSKRLACVVWGG